MTSCSVSYWASLIAITFDTSTTTVRAHSYFKVHLVVFLCINAPRN